MDKQLGKFMGIVKNLEVSIPFTELLTHMPTYAKYMKDILTKKKSIGQMETIALADASNAILQDRSTKKPLGVLEDIPVRVAKFFIPVDFVIVDMAKDAHIPIIFGRPFLHTAGAVIDVKNEMLTLEVGDERITFNLIKVMKAHNLEEPCFMVEHAPNDMDDKVKPPPCHHLKDEPPIEKSKIEPPTWG
ncbi:uncharacterized protein LOC141640828 [Silene latifolia]|uniref:uncharacterized protein LOC141640828 n=1 Tax=Silene latifolia TaxID=37657 RepID=UPI003D783EC3